MRTAAAAVALVFTAPAAAQMYKCVGSDGKTAYQSEACQGVARQTEIQPAATSGVSATADASRVREILKRYSLCESMKRGFGESRAPAYQQWRRHNGAALRAFEGDAKTQLAFRDEVAAERARIESDFEYGRRFHEGCDVEVPRMLAVTTAARSSTQDLPKLMGWHRFCRHVTGMTQLEYEPWTLRNRAALDAMLADPVQRARMDAEGFGRRLTFDKADAPQQERMRTACLTELKAALSEGA